MWNKPVFCKDWADLSVTDSCAYFHSPAVSWEIWQHYVELIVLRLCAELQQKPAFGFCRFFFVFEQIYCKLRWGYLHHSFHFSSSSSR